MPETQLHLELRTLLYQSLQDYLGLSATVGSEQFVYCAANDPKRWGSLDDSSHRY